MKYRSASFISLIFLLLSGSFLVHAENTVPGIATYDAYKSSVQRVCLGEGNTEIATPWKVARQNPLVTYVHIDYPDILSPESDTQFKAIIDRVK